MKLQPYWLDTAPSFTGGTVGPVEGKADVVVIGGGFTGLSAALALARQGADVTQLVVCDSVESANANATV